MGPDWWRYTPPSRRRLSPRPSVISSFSLEGESNVDEMCLVDHNGFFYWVGATDQRHEGNWLWESMEPVQDFVWFESKST